MQQQFSELGERFGGFEPDARRARETPGQVRFCRGVPETPGLLVQRELFSGGRPLLLLRVVLFGKSVVMLVSDPNFLPVRGSIFYP